MRQAEVVIGLKEGQLVRQTRLGLSEAADLAAQSRPMLTDRQIKAFNESGVDLLPYTTGLEDGLNLFQAAIHNPVGDADDPTFDPLFDQLGIV